MASKAIKSILIIVCVLTLGHKTSFSQRKAVNVLSKWAAIPVIADGNISEWGDTLTHFNEAAKVSYGMANDDKNLYLAIKSGSREALSKILMAGITFSANIESNKKDPPRIIFPVLDRTPGKPGKERIETSIEDRQKETISRIKDIKVFGFKEIVDGAVSLQNTYGIRAAAAFESQTSLVQEIIIPLSLLNLTPDDPNLITYSIKINGLNVPASQRSIDPRSSMGGMYGNQYPMPQVNRALMPSEFFITSKLAQKPR